MKNVTLTVPWGQYEPTVKKKKTEYKHSLLQCSFPPNNISQHRFVLKYRQIGTTFVLGTFEYMEADTHTAFSAFCRQLSILHGRYYGIHLSPGRNKHK